jgi:outer membrane murein-binding lipoprotein Lpp
MSDRAHQADIEAIQAALLQTSELLHGIVSRSDIKQIAAEVLRLNEAVRRGAAGRTARP